jgi:hypothetical protein
LAFAGLQIWQLVVMGRDMGIINFLKSKLG